MRKARAHSSLIRGVMSTGLLAFGCNAILGNEERSFVENIGGGTSGAGGTESTLGSGGTAVGGSGGTAPDAGGAGGSAGGGPAGAAGADQGGSESGGAASSSTAAGGSTTASSSSAAGGSTATASSSTATGGSGGTSEPCDCTSGDTRSMQEACGNCGTATVTQVCGEDCRWGEFGEPGECMNQGVCAPNEAGEQLLHCERGRWRYSRSTCDSDCQWGPWTETACEGADVCDGCACIAWCTDPNTGGTTCKWTGCTEAEARAECLTDLTAPDVDCTLKEPFTFKEWLPD